MSEQNHFSGDTGAFNRIPTWDGNPTTWRNFKRTVDVWLEGENLDVPYSLAARMLQKLTGTAKTRTQLIPLEELRPIRFQAAVAPIEASGTAPAVPGSTRHS